MKQKLITIIFILNVANANNCELIYIDVIKTKQTTKINTRYENKTYPSHFHTKKTNNKKIFKIKIDTIKYNYKDKKWYEYSWHDIKIKNKVKTKYAIYGNTLAIYIPEREKIENFTIEVCKKYFIKSIETTKKFKKRKKDIKNVTVNTHGKNIKKELQAAIKEVE